MLGGRRTIYKLRLDLSGHGLDVEVEGAKLIVAKSDLGAVGGPHRRHAAGPGQRRKLRRVTLGVEKPNGGFFCGWVGLTSGYMLAIGRDAGRAPIGRLAHSAESLSGTVHPD